MKPSLTRRELAGTVLSATAALTPQAAAQPAVDLEQAQESVVRTRELLSKYKVPMSLEPAFQFKA